MLIFPSFFITNPSDILHDAHVLTRKVLRLLENATNEGRDGRTTVVKSPYRCAGLNRYEAGEEESLRERSSDPLGPEFCVGYREVHSEA